MSTPVEYILSLKDQLSGKLSEANAHAKTLENTMGSVRGILGTLGIAFGAYQLVGFIKESTAQFHELSQETAKVEANLSATGAIAGMSLKDIQGYSKELSDHIHANRVQVMDMASQLLTFPAITKDVFQSSMGIVADIAKQTGHELSQTAIMYGKALTSPAEGLQKMQRYGVMFTDTEKQKITALQASGKLIEAQKLMIESIAHAGYAGVAQKMFDDDPIARFNKMIYNARIAIGEYVESVYVKVLPILTKWIKDIENIFISIKPYIINVFEPIVNLFKRITNDTSGWTDYLNIAKGIFSDIYPSIMNIAKKTADMVGDMIEFVKNSEMAKETFEFLGNIVSAMVEGISEMVDIVKELKDEFKDELDLLSDIWHFFDSAEEKAEMAKNQPKSQSEKNYEDSSYYLTHGFIKNNPIGKIGMADKTKATGADIAPKTKAEGQKTINIHVAYNAPLIKDFNINTTNIKQGLQSLKEEVTAILTSATHDSLLVAGD
jgi:hypothetical protein